MAIFVKKYMDVSRFTLWADGVGENTKARLVMGFRDGHPRFIVNTGVRGKEGLINFPSDVATITYFLSRLKEVADAEPGTRFSIDSFTTLYENDKPTKNKRLVSTVYVGKSAAGIVYISVIAENRPKIIFEIKPSEYHVFKDKDGEKIADDFISKTMAKGLAEFMLNILAQGIMQHSMEENVEYSQNNASTTPPITSVSGAPNAMPTFEDVPY